MSENSEVKILADEGDGLRVGGYGVRWGGRDLVGDTFLPTTDLWLDKLSPTPPVLFDHGGDPTLKRAVVGRVTSTHVDDVGLWIEAKITANRKYLDAIARLVKEGVLGWSSGAVGHLVERGKSGVLNSWAIAEFSLTPTPCEPRTLGVRQLKSLAPFETTLADLIDGDELIDARRNSNAPAREVTAAKGSPMSLPDSAFAFIAPGGHLDEERKTVPRASRHHPHHDESGDVDVESLKAALADPDLKSHGPVAHAHLLRHAKAAGLLEQKSADDAHDSGWSRGGPPTLLVLGYEIVAAAEAAIADIKAMEHMGHDTKSGERWTAPRLKDLLALRDRINQIATKAIETERGVDGAAVVETFRTAFQLLDLEEVA